MKILKKLTLVEWIIWIASLVAITISFIIAKNGVLNLITSLVGVSSLIFIAKGEPIGQIIVVVFCILYAIVSFQFKYYGELIIILVLTLPSAVISGISWIKHPYKEGESEVKIEKLSKKVVIILILVTILATVGMFFVLRQLNVPNLIVSTISVFTSFFAAILLVMRSPLYAISYALNDIVLIILWIFAAIESISYLSMVVCFVMFLTNDLYGFINWIKLRKKQM